MYSSRMPAPDGAGVPNDAPLMGGRTAEPKPDEVPVVLLLPNPPVFVQGDDPN